MRNYLLGISLILFFLSALLTFKALVIVSQKRESAKELNQTKPTYSRSESTPRSRFSSREPSTRQDTVVSESDRPLSGQNEQVEQGGSPDNSSSLSLAKPTVVVPDVQTTPPVASQAIQSDSTLPLESVSYENALVLGVLGGFTPTTEGPANDSELNGTVAELVPLVLSSPGNKLIIEGHTDKLPDVSPEMASLETAKIISRNWAQSVGDLFIKNGVPAKQITVIGYGYTQPISSNDTAEARIKNRRVVIKLVITE